MSYELALLRSGLRAVYGALSRPPAPAPLTEEQKERRFEILVGVDEQACQRCGVSALDVGAADDPAWFIDAELAPNPSVPAEPVSLAVIYCPACW